MKKRITCIVISMLVLATFVSCPGDEGPSGTEVEYTGTGGSIPAASGTPSDTAFAVNVPETGNIVSFESVAIAGLEYFSGDYLEIVITSPDNTTVILSAEERALPGSWFDGDYTYSNRSSASNQYSYETDPPYPIVSKEYKADGDLGNFNGKSMNGNWSVRMINHSGMNTGSFVSFTIKFYYN